MSLSLVQFEQSLFRRLNAVVEPAVRKGIGSPVLAPASLIVLETIGFKSGARRRTPLWSLRLGRYRLVSTARGERSFWVKNLLQEPRVSYYLGGKRRDSTALVITGGSAHGQTRELPPLVRTLAKLLTRHAREGWAFAILVPGKINPGKY